ncbi:hypothetical protein KKA14_20940, partial [bacterium]|nr:hypothetical protein [bacterium]
FEGQKREDHPKCYKVFCDRDTPCEDCFVRKVFETSEPNVKETFNEVKSEHREVRSSPIFDESGSVKYVIEHSIDITKRKEGEEKLIQARKKAEEANKMKSDFLAKVSHELRTPMNGILGFAKLGRERSDRIPREKIKDYFTVIAESGLRLQTFLHDLLDLSRLESGKMAFDFQNEKISMITTIVLDELFTTAKESRVIMEFSQPDFSDYALVDVDKIGQVIRNLLTSAIKFTDADSALKIEINDKQENILFSVFASGTGIPEDDSDELFGKSIPGGKSKAGSGDTGLGMTISKEIIASHGGKLWVEDNPANEVIFRFEIPKKPDSPL